MTRLYRLLNGVPRGLAPMLLTVLLVAGCQSVGVNYTNKTVPQNKWIRILMPGEQSGKWSTNDVNLDYRYAGDGNTLRISGEVHYADPIRYNFAVIQYFHMDVIFIDPQGRVLGTEGLVSDTNNSLEPSGITFPVTFDRLVRLPPNTVSIAFSYTGTARDSGRRGDFNITSFWEYPIQ